MRTGIRHLPRTTEHRRGPQAAGGLTARRFPQRHTHMTHTNTLPPGGPLGHTPLRLPPGGRGCICGTRPLPVWRPGAPRTRLDGAAAGAPVYGRAKRRGRPFPVTSAGSLLPGTPATGGRNLGAASGHVAVPCLEAARSGSGRQRGVAAVELVDRRGQQPDQPARGLAATSRNSSPPHVPRRAGEVGAGASPAPILP